MKIRGLKLSLIFLVLVLARPSFADSPPSTVVKAKTFSGDGNTGVTTTGTSLNVNVTNPGGGTQTVNQGTAGIQSWLASITSSVLPTNACQESGGHLSSIDNKLTSPLAVTGSFYQATQPVSGTLTCNAGSGTLLVDGSAHTQPVSGSVSISGTPNVAVTSLPSLPSGSNAIGSVSVSNFPSTQTVAGTVGLSAGSATIGAVNINGTVPISGTVTATNSANGTTGAAAPSQATQTAGVDGSGVLRALSVDALGNLNVNNINQLNVTGSMTTTGDSTCQVISTGVSTVAIQPTGSWSGLLVLQGSVDNSNWSNIPLYDLGSRSAQQYMTYNSLFTASVGGATYLRIYATNIGSGPVSLQMHGNAGNGAISATSANSDAFFATVNLRDGLGNPISSTSGRLAVDGTGGSFPVTAASLPLPTGAATAAKQPALGTAGTPSSDVLTVQGAASMTALKVDGSAVTQPVSAASLPLPSGAATSAAQTTGNASLATIATNIPAQGQALAAASMPVVLPAAQVTALTPPTTVTVTQATGTNLHTVVDSGSVSISAVPPDVTPATQNITVVDTGTTSNTYSNGQVWITGTPTAGSAASFTISSVETGMLVISGTFTGTVQVETSQDGGTTYVPHGVHLIGSAIFAATFTAPVTGSINLSGKTQIRVRATAAMTGTANVLLRTSTNPSNVYVANGLKLVDSTATSSPPGDTIKAASTAAIATDTALVVAVSPNNTPVLPSGASTAANQATEISSLQAIDAGIPAGLGQTTMANSMAVAIASDQSNLPVVLQDLFVTGQSAQTATVNNILTASSGTAANDLLGYRSGLVQVVSTGTGGTFIFEGSNDNTNFQTIPVYSQLVTTGTPIVAAITASASQLGYTFPIQFRYIRLRIATTITGGSIQAFSRFSQEAWIPAVTQVAQNTAASLLTTATIGSGTITSVTSDNLAIPGIIADVASAAITTTTTTATLTPTNGVGYKVTIPVTVVSGTTPTLVVAVQESGDTGTDWVTVYTFPTITTTGYYESPPLFFKGNRVRYVQTITGTTPSFTRAINRLQMSAVAAAPVNNNATFATATVSSSCSTLTAPANAVEFTLENLSSNTVNMFWTIGATAATSTTGMLLEPGRDITIRSGQNISLCAASGTPTYSLQWVQQ